MATAEAKGKIRARHKEAIGKFIEWQLKNPEATLKVQVKEFDKYVDIVAYKAAMKKGNAN